MYEYGDMGDYFDSKDAFFRKVVLKHLFLLDLNLL